MKCTFERREGGLVRLAASFNEAEVLSAWKKAASRFTPQIAMAGFRPGKAPLAVIERQFGGRISDMATDMLVDGAVRRMLSENKVVPAGAFDYEGGNASRGSAFSFTIEFAEAVRVDAPGLEGLRLPVEEAVADPVQERGILENMAGRRAVTSPVAEGRPGDGDLVTAEVTGEIDGNVVAGMKKGTCRIRLAPHREGEKVPDLDPVLRALSVGETGHGTTVCPENYPDPTLRGRNIDLTVTLKAIERRVLPEFDDALARGLGFRDMAAMRAEAHGRALDMDRRYRELQARRSLTSMLENMEDVVPPAALVDECRREAVHEAMRYLQNRYPAGEGLRAALDGMKKEAAASAVRKARGRIILLSEALGRGIGIGDAEFNAVLAGRAAQKGMGPDDFRLSIARTGEEHALRASMLAGRALDELLAAARVR